jgi:Rrf2 family protein
MAENCRFAFAVHICTVLAVRAEVGVSSEELARSVNTNPVVIRRLIVRLSRAGIVRTVRGPRGGARLASSPEQVTLAMIYDAVDGGAGFASHPKAPNPCCPVGKHITAVLTDVFAEAEAAHRRALERRNLAAVLARIGEEPVEDSGRNSGT